jgi:hypothetical protein
LKGDARAASSLLSVMMRLLDTGEGVEPEGSEDFHPDELEILEAYKERLTRAHAKEPAAEAADSPEESS